MADIDQPQTLGPQVADDAEQPLDFRWCQRGARLVHDQDARVKGKRLGDFEKLLLRHRKVTARHVRVDFHPEPSE